MNNINKKEMDSYKYTKNETKENDGFLYGNEEFYFKYEKADLYKELDLIQACIKRMSNFSFNLRGWYISIVTVGLSILIGQKTQAFLVGVFSFCISSVLWGLDGFFLKMETMYRWKYEWLIKERCRNNMTGVFDLNPRNKKMWLEPNKKKCCIFKFIMSKTLIPLYGILWSASIGMIIYGLIH